MELSLGLQELKACFESRDIELLQKTIAAMPVEEAKYHMKRCVDSGLWVPNAADAPLDDGDNDEAKEDDTAEAPADGAASTETDTKKTTESPKKIEKSPAKEEPIYTGVSTEDVD